MILDDFISLNCLRLGLTDSQHQKALAQKKPPNALMQREVIKSSRIYEEVLLGSTTPKTSKSFTFTLKYS